MKKQTKGWKRIIAVTLALLNDCPVDMTDWTIGSNGTGTITLDLAGHALVTPEDYSLVLNSNNSIVMSSQDGGELRGEGVYVAREKTAVFKENVKVTGMLSVTQTDVTVRIEGASIAKLKFSEGSCRISSGSVEEIEWRNVGLAITGGTIGNLNCIYSYLKPSTAFPDGYGVKTRIPEYAIPERNWMRRTFRAKWKHIPVTNMYMRRVGTTGGGCFFNVFVSEWSAQY